MVSDVVHDTPAHQQNLRPKPVDSRWALVVIPRPALAQRLACSELSAARHEAVLSAAQSLGGGGGDLCKRNRRRSAWLGDPAYEMVAALGLWGQCHFYFAGFFVSVANSRSCLESSFVRLGFRALVRGLVAVESC